MWAIPFYLWTVLLCLWDCWFLAGMVMAVGAMLQGQLMFVAPIFVLWPLLAKQWQRTLRVVAGFALGFMLVVSPWMLTLRPNVHEPARVLNWPAVKWVAISWAVLLIVGLIWRRTWVRYALALAAAGCLLLCVPWFGAGTAWWEIGFLYGAEKFPNVGSNMTANLPTIVTTVLGWQNVHEVVWEIPKGWLWGWPSIDIGVTPRQVFLPIYVVLFLGTGWAMARHWRNAHEKLLVAVVLPWVLFFTVLPQMSPRYAVFAAGVGAICVGYSFAMPLLVWCFAWSLAAFLFTGPVTLPCMRSSSAAGVLSRERGFSAWVFNTKPFTNMNGSQVWRTASTPSGCFGGVKTSEPAFSMCGRAPG
jgi:hypothetical protein